MNVKLFQSLLTLLVVVKLCSALPAFAQDEKGEPSQSYKCYLSYLGGGDGIHYIHTSKGIEHAKGYFSGRKVNPFGGKNVAQVYKVSECVIADKSFTIGRAQVLDKKDIR
jgi:hypothetical protein